jgi:hypothetical protein
LRDMDSRFCGNDSVGGIIKGLKGSTEETAPAPRLFAFNNSACGIYQNMHTYYHGPEPFVLCLTVIVPVVNLLGDHGEPEEAETVVKIKTIGFKPGQF